MASLFCLVDDKHIPLYRILWISDLPHFCGEEACECEGRYEVRLEEGESVWGSREDRDNALRALVVWHYGLDEEEEDEEHWDES